jgi:hypothetical protein
MFHPESAVARDVLLEFDKRIANRRTAPKLRAHDQEDFMSRNQSARRSQLSSLSKLLVLAPVLASVAAQGGDGLAGDWEIHASDAGEERLSILSVDRYADTRLSGWWITDARRSELEDIKCDDGRFSFKWEELNRNGDPTTWTFSGKIEDDNLRGTVTNDREHQVVGERIPPMPQIVGNWAFSYTREQVTLALAVRAGSAGGLTLFWQTADGDVPITDPSYEAGKLTFTSESGNYEGRLAGADALNGTLTVDQREFPVLASRMGMPLIGSWDLEVTSERETHPQRLKINPDMSGWYGTIPIDDVRLEHDMPGGRDRASHTVTFNAGSESDERGMFRFAGEVLHDALTGEISSSTGRSTVVGRKLNSHSQTNDQPQ